MTLQETFNRTIKNIRLNFLIYNQRFSNYKILNSKIDAYEHLQ